MYHQLNILSLVVEVEVVVHLVVVEVVVGSEQAPHCL
jgi:hypothetical protein